MNYIECLEQYLIANDISAEAAAKCQAILLSTCGYQLIRTLLSPVLPRETSSSTIVEKVEAHLNPKPSEIAEQYNFHSRIQKVRESVSTFAAEL